MRASFFFFSFGLWKLEKIGGKNQSCGFVFDFSQLHVSLILGQPCHLLAADPTELRLAWQEVLKGCRQKSSIEEHAVLTVRVFSHTCPIKNPGPSWINYIAAFTLKWKEMLCAPPGARLLLGSWQMHLAQHPSMGLCSSAPSRCVASVRATWQWPVREPSAHFLIVLMRLEFVFNGQLTVFFFMMSTGIQAKWKGTSHTSQLLWAWSYLHF